jgi:hypothetical protein
MEHIEVPHTHYETMCSDLVVNILQEKYQNANIQYQEAQKAKV